MVDGALFRSRNTEPDQTSGVPLNLQTQVHPLPIRQIPYPMQVPPSASLLDASGHSVFDQVTPVRMAPVKVALYRSALVRSTLVRLALVKLALLAPTLVRLALARLAPARSVK